MSTGNASFEPSSSLTRLLAIGGGILLLYRLMQGLGSLLWTVFGLAVAFYFMGGFGWFE